MKPKKVKEASCSINDKILNISIKIYEGQDKGETCKDLYELQCFVSKKLDKLITHRN